MGLRFRVSEGGSVLFSIFVILVDTFNIEGAGVGIGVGGP